MERDASGNVPIGISPAPSGRSKCQRCKTPIGLGDMRVSFPGRHNGLSVAKYLKPRCFAKRCLRLDYAPTNRAKCAADGTPISKGEPRLLMQIRNCRGEVSSQKIYRPPSASGFLTELFGLPECARLTTDHIASYADPEHREWVADALRGVDVSSRPTPVRAPAEKGPSASKAKKASTSTKKRASKEVSPPPAKATKASSTPRDGGGKRPRRQAESSASGSKRVKREAESESESRERDSESEEDAELAD